VRYVTTICWNWGEIVLGINSDKVLIHRLANPYLSRAEETRVGIGAGQNDAQSLTREGIVSGCASKSIDS